MSNVLAVGDLHSPFHLDGYLDHVISVYNRFKCDRVVFIGDIVDGHYSSFHATDPDGLGGGDELDLAIDRLSYWIGTFPDAYVCTGNHDRIVARKAFDGGIPRRWLREYKDVLGAPGWRFVDEVLIDGVCYTHGDGGGTARRKALREQCSIVQGHFHTQFYLEYNVGRNSRIFAAQIGCGIDRKSYAMSYAKSGPKPAIGCAVVLDNGNLPILCPMELGGKW